MWILHNAKLINTNALAYIDCEKTRINGHLPNGEIIVIGEFWTNKEATEIFISVKRALTSGENFIIVRDTRDGMRCLKKKK